MIKFRVYIPVSYKDLYFDFKDPQEAIDYALTTMKHLAADSDIEVFEDITITIVNEKENVIDVEQIEEVHDND